MTRVNGDATDEGFARGDHVRWNTPQGKTTGTVVEKLTSETEIKGHDARASSEAPQYLVQSDETGAEAAHKPESLESLEKVTT